MSSSSVSVGKGPPASKLTDFADVRIGDRRVGDIQMMICFRSGSLRALVEMCSNYLSRATAIRYELVSRQF